MTTPPSRDRPDHPRIRGEHPPGGWRCPQTTGSSPHTRGARLGLAGWSRRAEDHPRIRGEHVAADQGAQGGEGIIPAYAGST